MITIIGGGFTRSWLSLPLSHGTKVKGGKKSNVGGLVHTSYTRRCWSCTAAGCFSNCPQVFINPGLAPPFVSPIQNGQIFMWTWNTIFLSLPCVPTLLWLNPTGLRWSGHGLKFNPAFWVAWLENYGCLLHLLLLILAVSLLLLIPFPIL